MLLLLTDELHEPLTLTFDLLPLSIARHDKPLRQFCMPYDYAFLSYDGFNLTVSTKYQLRSTLMRRIT